MLLKRISSYFLLISSRVCSTNIRNLIMEGEPLSLQGLIKYKNPEEPYLLEANLPTKNPFELFDCWFKHIATQSDLSFEEINAVSLSTCVDNKPSSRMVLLKSYDSEGFTFYSNKVSRKGREIAANPYGAMLLYWPKVSRQIRIEGKIVELDSEKADEYWYSRPLGSRIGSKASEQGKVIESRKVLEDKKEELETLAKNEGEGAIKRPPTWIGYKLVPDAFEFWQGQSNRLHDRIHFKLADDNSWNMTRLSP
uniref:pyridoxal 5'-phosphate synthase n=1 Tax=Strongyloides papillosus TaxID=174720 RepID=A0A0N5BPS1_STREA